MAKKIVKKVQSKKKKPKKRVLSKTEVKYKNQQYKINKKLKSDFEFYKKLIAEPNQSKFIDFDGNKLKIRTVVNKILRRVNKLGNELSIITNKRVKLTRGKYKPKNPFSIPENVKIDKQFEKEINVEGLVKWSVYNYWEFNDFQTDLLSFFNDRYTYTGMDPVEFGDIISELINELFFDLSVSSNQGKDYPVLVLYIDKKKKDMKAIIFESSDEIPNKI